MKGWISWSLEKAPLVRGRNSGIWTRGRQSRPGANSHRKSIGFLMGFWRSSEYWNMVPCPPKPSASKANSTKHKPQGSNWVGWYLFCTFSWFPSCPTMLFPWSSRSKVSWVHPKSRSLGPLNLEIVIKRVYFERCVLNVWSFVSNFLFFLLCSQLPRFGGANLAHLNLWDEVKPWELRSKELDFNSFHGSL